MAVNYSLRLSTFKAMRSLAELQSPLENPPMIFGWSEGMRHLAAVDTWHGNSIGRAPHALAAKITTHAAALTAENIDEWIGLMFVIVRFECEADWRFRLDSDAHWILREGQLPVPEHGGRPSAGVFAVHGWQQRGYSSSSKAATAARRVYDARWGKESRLPENVGSFGVTDAPTPTGWELIGEDFEAIGARGHLPLDWRTKAKALIAHEDRESALESLASAIVKHGWICIAPPGEGYGSEYYNWDDAAPVEVCPGWVELGEEHEWCFDPGDPGDGAECCHDDIICLCLTGSYDEMDSKDIWAAVISVCESAPPEIGLVCPGEGWPWVSRNLGPCTVVIL